MRAGELSPNGQTQPSPTSAGREERLEHVPEHVRRNSRPAVLDLKQIPCAVDSTANLDWPARGELGCVAYDVEHDLSDSASVCAELTMLDIHDVRSFGSVEELNDQRSDFQPLQL